MLQYIGGVDSGHAYVYEGWFINGLPEGVGRKVNQDGTVYTGTFRFGLENGEGVRVAKTEGVYPLVVGGSPMARPISRMAMAKRVTESIINKTFLPWLQKYSAIVVATNAPRILRSGG